MGYDNLDGLCKKHWEKRLGREKRRSSWIKPNSDVIQRGIEYEERIGKQYGKLSDKFGMEERDFNV